MRSRSCVDRASCLDSSVRSATGRRTTTTADHTTGQPTTLLPAPTRRLTALPATDCGSCSASAREVRPSRTATMVRGPRPPDLRVPEAALPASRPGTLSGPLWDTFVLLGLLRLWVAAVVDDRSPAPHRRGKPLPPSREYRGQTNERRRRQAPAIQRAGALGCSLPEVPHGRGINKRFQRLLSFSMP